MQTSNSRRKAGHPLATDPSPAAHPLRPPRTILLVKTSSLGDVIHNLPAASDLHRRFPQAQIDWLVEESFADIPRLHPAIRHVIPIAVRRWRKTLTRATTWRELATARLHLRQVDYDLVLDTQGLIKSALLASQTHLTPTGRRCGYAAEAAREPLAARCYDQSYAIPRNVHAVERNRWLAAAACDYTPDLPLDYGLNNIAARPYPDQPSGAYAVLLTATSRDDKLWPEAHWLELIGALNTAGLHCLLPAGSHVERERAQRLAQTASRMNSPAPGHPTVCVAPPMSITTLAGLCAGARIVIGVDTGLTHLATALGRPTIAIFCASNPALTGVYAGDPPIHPAINLGTAGAPPTAALVIQTAHHLLPST